MTRTAPSKKSGTLLIVESPTKAKTISRYLGSAFSVVASVGHIRDLPKSNKYAIDIPGGFIPHYEITKGKEPVIHDIERAAQKAKAIYLATDPDREGEAIAWHVAEACKLKNAQRVVFHEITPTAVAEALEHPRPIDIHLLKAQEARRVLDRLVGYDLSGLIWKKVRYGLSAGRVQSPALRIIVEREREIRAFIPVPYWTIEGVFALPDKQVLTLICETEPATQKETDRIIAAAQKGAWTVLHVQETETKRSPRPPFTTSTLQQSASSRLGFTPSRTMSVAQKLYEQGLITYMRTDSVSLGKEAAHAALAYVAKTFGSEYASPRTYTTKSKTAQEAHEAIRPTTFSSRRAGATDEQHKLYELIFDRAVSSQMADARLMRTKISANVTENTNTDTIPDFSATGTRVLFPGWLAGDPRSRGEDVELPHTTPTTPLTLKEITGTEKHTEPPARYTEAGLVKELEKRDIGRPSTYASIIKTLYDRGYIDRDGRALVPTATGDVVSTFLEKHFAHYISDSFTAEMENDLDEIAEGTRDYTKTLKDFYTPFLKEVKAKATAEKITNLGDADPAHTCPTCGGKMVIKLGRSGTFLSCAKFPDCKGARKLDGSELEAPRETGEACPDCSNGKLIEREGRFGKFIACSNYPKCKYVKKSAEEEAKNKTGVSCPTCSLGELIGRRGRFGVFYSCSNYPTCKFIIKSRPTGARCALCSSLMMEGTKTIPERCSNKKCPNHNPHKLKK